MRSGSARIAAKAPRRLPALLLTAVLLGSGCTDDEAGRPRGEEDQTTTASSTTAADPCADGDCTLAEAAERAGIHIGVHIEEWNEPDLELAAEQFDTLSNHGIGLDGMQPERGRFDFAAADRAMEYARANDMTTHGFHWLWNQELLDNTPDWVEAITDPEELWEVLEGHLEAVAGRYEDLDRINVVNEPFALPGGEPYRGHLRAVLGDDFIAEAFRRADPIAGDTLLFLNENLIEYSPERAAALVALVSDLVARDVPIDGVGFQSHFFAGEPDFELLRSTMAAIDALGLTTSLTELDVPAPADTEGRFEVQADRYAGAVQTCLSVPGCDTVIVWGVQDGATWVDDFLGPGYDPLLYDRDLEPKPAWFAVREALLAAGPA